MSKHVFTNNKDLRKILGQLEEQGWTIVKTAGRHLRCLSPDGVTAVITGSTPSDARSNQNFKSQLRRAGAVVR